jgi:mannose-6-phosphate isomerase-like protein (cupin superfamily)
MSNFADVAGLSSFSPDKMKKNNIFTTERFFCDVYCFEPGQQQTPHSHSGSDKVYYVLEGSGRIQIGEESRQVGEGTAVLAPSGVEHAVTNDGTRRLKLLVFMAPKP